MKCDFNKITDERKSDILSTVTDYLTDQINDEYSANREAERVNVTLIDVGDGKGNYNSIQCHGKDCLDAQPENNFCIESGWCDITDCEMRWLESNVEFNITTYEAYYDGYDEDRGW